MIKIGTRLQISIEGRDRKLDSELVGVKNNEYLIVKLPENILYMGHKLIVRYMHGSKIYAFRSTVLANIFEPDILVFLKFPHEIEGRDLRQTPRFPCSLPSNAEIGIHVVQAVISDISSVGAMLSVDKEHSGLRESRMKIGSKITLTTFLPGDESQHTLLGELKNVSSNKHLLRVGMAFTETDMRSQESLTNYIKAIKFSFVFDD